MRKIILPFILITLTSCNSKQDYSEILILPQKTDIGKVKLGSVNYINVVLNNPSEVDLHILGIKPSCDCTITQTEEFIISKKQTDTLKIVYKPTELGKHSESITIKSNTNPPFNNFLIQSDVIN